MGYIGKLNLKIRAIALRKQGASYQEILQEVQVSKDTISRWCRDVILTPKQLERLQTQKKLGGQRGGEVGAQRKRANRIDQTNLLKELAAKELGNLTNRDRFIAGVSLYLGDGLKSDREVGFANSNPQLVRFMVGWLREYCEIKEEKLRGQLWIHDTCDETKAKQFWSKLTGIPTDKFLKSYIAINKKDSLKVRKQLHEYGIFTVRVFSAEIQRKILGWGTGIFG